MSPVASRRRFVFSTLAASTALGTLGIFAKPRKLQASEGEFEITKSEAEWREILTDQQYAVLRGKRTRNAPSPVR